MHSSSKLAEQLTSEFWVNSRFCSVQTSEFLYFRQCFHKNKVLAFFVFVFSEKVIFDSNVSGTLRKNTQYSPSSEAVASLS